MQKFLQYPIEISIDQGGTFTDIYARASKRVLVEKLLSTDPKHYGNAPLEGIKRILRSISTETNVDDYLNPKNFKFIRMGTTVTTNALLQRKGTPTVLAITHGFEDLLRISDQTRPQLFELDISRPKPLYQKVLGIRERIVPCRNGFQVRQSLDREHLRANLSSLRGEGFNSIAVVLMHAYAQPAHELEVREIASDCGFSTISLSHQVMPSIKILNRGNSTVLDAYLNPIIKDYLNSFLSAFQGEFQPGQILFMQSDGSLCEYTEFCGSKSLLSGPAGGVVGYSRTLFSDSPLIGYDMGGTSTDVSRYDGSLELETEHTIAGLPIKTAQLPIFTVAAGGGSRLGYENGLLFVSPLSSGADPGPLCYDKGGKLSLTDANLLLGRLLPEYFPKVFGKSGDLPLNPLPGRLSLENITSQVNEQIQAKGGKKLSPEEVAMGFIRIANETMVRPILETSAEKGFRPSEHSLACFGGAGAQHACSIARSLGIRRVLIPANAGILSAVGISLARRTLREFHPVQSILNTSSKDRIRTIYRDRVAELSSGKPEWIPALSLAMRYEGTDTQLRIEISGEDCWERDFESHYLRVFGFLPPNQKIIVEEACVSLEEPEFQFSAVERAEIPGDLECEEVRECYFEQGFLRTPVYQWDSLKIGNQIQGPALIVSPTFTTVLEPNCLAVYESGEVLSIEVTPLGPHEFCDVLDPVELSLFQQRFMSLAEQMGRMFQRTSVSTNIKERLDFSCALFDELGNLVSNAPHIPVHLGSMGLCIREALKHLKVLEGDVWITNHPNFGGTHLPDITVITPHFHRNRLVGFLASRGHHADIGGTSPGSMPANSQNLEDEGVMIEPSILVHKGKFQEKMIVDLLKKAGARLISDNLSDLKAQVSANQRGAQLLEELILTYSEKTLRNSMAQIQAIGENAVRSFFLSQLKFELESEEIMDDGSRIHLLVKINKDTGGATFDFRASSDQLKGNTNAPRAVVSSAIMYCLRCLIKQNLPLNEGFMKPISILTRQGSIVDPELGSAVAAGNVTTSQRIVDTIFLAFQACAASQGCMNNLSLGNQHYAYYETIGGGAGAGPGFAGEDGVHTHMTNTRATDPEVLEQNFPLLLHEFSLRKNSGGKGQFQGGDGLIREMEFREPMEVNLLTERRIQPPYGMLGGKEGACGKNWYFSADAEESPIPLEGKSTLKTRPGDRIRIETPGGGGYGRQG
jgi:5-oxoprolinase (ATP-hydrolysing)